VHRARYGGISFEWDTAKAASNLGKHGVSFLEAMTVFIDPLACIVENVRSGEDR
jgi:uncharacterized DUF497 family protein